MLGAVLSWVLRLGVHLWTKGAVAGRVANACLLDSPRRLLCRLHLQRLFLWISPHLTCVSVCLSLGLLQSLSPTRRQRAGRHPWPLHRPTLAPTRPPWSTAGAEAAGQLVQLLDSRALVSSSVSRSTSTRGRREKGCGHRSPGEAEYRPAARKMSPNMHRQGQGRRVKGEGSSQQLLSELVKDHGGLEVGGLHALAEGDEEVHDLADFGQLRQALPELEGVGLVPVHGV